MRRGRRTPTPKRWANPPTTMVPTPHPSYSRPFTPSDKAELKAATDAWMSNASAAEATYGHVGAWNPSRLACSPECVSGGALEMARCCAEETNPRRRLTANNSLLTCDFDNSTCGFDYTTDYDWTRLSGWTPSSGTGPSSDHTSGSGYYMYVEASSPNNPSVGPYTLASPTFDECVGEVKFYYHLYGSGRGTLQREQLWGNEV